MVETHVDITFFTQNKPMNNHPKFADISWYTLYIAQHILNLFIYVGFEVLMAVSTKMAVF
jgi:hypothetical protein